MNIANSMLTYVVIVITQQLNSVSIFTYVYIRGIDTVMNECSFDIESLN